MNTLNADNRHSVLRSNHTKISTKFGFLGVGMGGTSIAAACADIETNVQNNKYPYNALLVNTNEIDLAKLSPTNPNTRKLLIGNGAGAGRNIKLGEEIFVKYQERIAKEANVMFSDTDFVWVVAGLGGGTGTGSVVEAIRVLDNNGFRHRFGLILTLPRLSEGYTVLKNALIRLQTIHRAMRGLGSIILVDNQKLYDHYSKNQSSSSTSEYLDFSNNFVAETLHELNVVTSSFKPVGESHFDSSEFQNLIKSPGVIHFARMSINASEIDTLNSHSYIGRLKEQIESGVLSDGYNLKNSTRLAVSILARDATASRLFNFDFNNSVEQEIDNIAPRATEKPVAHYAYDTGKGNEVYFYAAFAGLQLPSRVREISEEIVKLEEINNSKEDDDDFDSIFSNALDNRNEPDLPPAEESFDELFGLSKKDNEKKDESTISDDVLDNFLK